VRSPGRDDRNGVQVAALRFLRRAAPCTGRRCSPSEGKVAFDSPRRPGLSIKLLCIVVGVSLLGVSASSFLMLTLQRQELIASAEAASARLSRTIGTAMAHAMLSNDWTIIDTIVQNVADGETVDRVRILDPQGVARVSSSPSEVGTRFDRSGPVCQSCHAAGNVPGAYSAVTTLGGHEELLTISPLRNEAACQECHTSEGNILGYLLIETPLRDLQRQLQAGFWRMALVALGTLVLLVGLMLYALRRLVTQPVGELARGLAEIGAGNLDCDVRVQSHDELGRLAGSFRQMCSQLRSSLAESERRSAELAMLNEVAVAAGQLLDLQEVLDLALDIVVNRLGMHAGLIYLRDPETGRYAMRATRGATPEQCAEINRRREQPEYDIPQQVVASGRALYVPRMAMDRRHDGIWGQEERRSYVNVPLKSKGAVVGSLGLVGRVDQTVTEEQVRVLEAVGHEIGIAIDNALLVAATRRGEYEATALYKLGVRISASLDLQQVLEAVAEGARDVLGAEAGLVGLLSPERQQVEIKAAAGAGAEGFRGQWLPLGKGQPGEALLRREPIVAGRLGLQPFGEPVGGEGVVTFLAVPLERANNLRGLVAVAARAPRRFTAEDVHLLNRLAQQVAVAIENAQLYQSVRRLAVLEERERLAREMHDNLAQSLGYLNLKASVTDWLLENHRLDEARASLRELREVSMSAYRDVRESIFSLRTAATPGQGFLPTLREYLEEYRTHYGVNAELEVAGAGLTDLPTDMGVQVTRIVQEALTNVRKHAGTDRAWVRLVRSADGLEIVVEDRGRGFDLDQATAEGRQCFGLDVMRERAAGVGGELTIESRPGEGTRVRVWVPLTIER